MKLSIVRISILAGCVLIIILSINFRSNYVDSTGVPIYRLNTTGKVHDAESVICATGDEILQAEPDQLIYNMVPKCGSDGLRHVLRHLQRKNPFHIIPRKYTEPHITVPYHISLKGINNTVQREILEAPEPWIYYGHIHFIDFKKYNLPMRPVYINIVRDPIDRLASFYYFRRDRKYFIPRPFHEVFAALNESVSARKIMKFDDCVKNEDIECHDYRFIFQIIPFFCGQDPMCIHPSDEALEQAKRHVLQHFSVIGYLQKYAEFLEVVQHIFPTYFKGAMTYYKALTNATEGVYHKTKIKYTVSPKIRQILLQRKDIQLEYDFYQFVKQRFDTLYKQLTTCKR